MKRIFCLFLFLAICLFADGQNYQCLQPGVKHYFTNDIGYLRGIRIDSVKTSGDSTVYYPYHTPRGYNISPVPVSGALLDSNGGSWLGKHVVQRSDGTFLFDNLWNDTVVIKTQANTGDTWIFYSDTTTHYYQANLVSSDTMTILGTIDSVKTIIITAHGPTGIVTTDPVDSFKIMLSKNNGFVQVFDLFTFPYHAPDSLYRRGLDYFLDLIIPSTGTAIPSLSNSIFSLVAFINPTSQQLYNFSIGDVSEYSACNDPDVSLYCTDISYGFDSVIAKYASGDNIVYHFAGSLNSFDPLIPFYSFDSAYNTLTFGNSLLIDTVYMPEEFNQEQTYYYLPYDSSYCMLSPEYEITPNNLSGLSILPVSFEGPSIDSKYKLGLGQTHYEYWAADILFFIQQNDLIYYRNSSTLCGSFMPLEVKESSAAQSISLYPNPASISLTITSASKISQITITNLLGQAAYTNNYDTDQVQVDISTLPSGVYLIRINGTEVRKFVKQ